MITALLSMSGLEWRATRRGYQQLCREEKRPILVAIRIGCQDDVYANATIAGLTWTAEQEREIVTQFKSYGALFDRVDVKRDPVSVVHANFRHGMGDLALWSVADYLKLRAQEASPIS
jgi:hypothetical protein